MVPIQMPKYRDMPRLDEPGQILGLTLLVSVQCQCGAPTLIGLLNAQPAVCETCGAVFSLDAVSWNKDHPTPTIAMRATPSRAKTLLP